MDDEDELQLLLKRIPPGPDRDLFWSLKKEWWPDIPNDGKFMNEIKLTIAGIYVDRLVRDPQTNKFEIDDDGKAIHYQEFYPWREMLPRD